MSAIETRNIVVPIAGGMDAGGTDPHLVDGKNLVLRNVRQPRRGVIAKRFGTHTHQETNYSSDSNHVAIGEYKDSPVLFAPGDPGDVYIGADANDDEWAAPSSASVYAPCEVTVEPIGLDSGSDSANNFIWTECARNSTHTLVCSSSSGAAILNYPVFRVHDNTTLVRVDSFEPTLNGGFFIDMNTPRVGVTANGTLYAIWIDGDVISFITVDSSGNISSETTRGTATSPSITLAPTTDDSPFDCCPLDGDNVGIAYEYASGLAAIVLDVSDGSIGGNYSTTVGGGPGGASWGKWVYCMPFGAGNDWLAIWQTPSTSPSCVVLTNAAAQAHGAPVTNSGTVPYDRCVAYQLAASPTSVTFIGWGSTASARISCRTSTIIASGTIGWNTAAPGYVKGRMVPACRPWVDANDDVYMLWYHQGGDWLESSPEPVEHATRQRVYIITKGLEQAIGATLIGTAGLPIGDADNWSRAYYAGSGAQPPSVPAACFGQSTDQSTVYVALLRRVGDSDNETMIAEVNIAPERINALNADGSVLLSGAMPAIWTGGEFRPQTFYEWPSGITVADAGGGSGVWGSTGSVGFICVFEMTDAAGNVIQSATSRNISYTLGATTEEPQLTINTHAIPYEDWFDGTEVVRIVVYRTGVNGTDYFRMESIVSDISAETVTSSAFLGDENTFSSEGEYVPIVETLYTDGGVLDVDSAPPHSCACIHQNRYLSNDLDNPRTCMRVTRELIAGRGVPHSSALKVPVSQQGGDLSAIASHRESIYIFKNRALFMTSGEGPDDTGGGSQYYRPRLVSAHVGCVNPATLVEIPQGLAFLSQDGLYIVDGGALRFLGHPVRYFTDTYTYRMGAVHPEQNIAIWVGSGPALVFNYLYETWSIWEGNWSNMLHVRSVNGLLWGVGASGKVITEDESKFTDDTTGYARSVETQTFNLGGMLLNEFRLKRVLILGYSLTDCDLEISFQFDRDPKWLPGTVYKLDSSTMTHLDFEDHIDPDGNVLATRGTAMIVEVKSPRQKMNSVRMRIKTADSTLEATTQGQCDELTGIVFVVAQRRQAALIGANRKAS